MSAKIYKVVAAQWQDDQIVLTGCLGLLDPELCVAYGNGLRTEPTYPDSYLYAFNDRDTALAYPKHSAEILKASVQLQVWEGQGEVVLAQPVIGAWYDYKKFWDMQLFAISDSRLGDWITCPPNSIWCTWIELTRMIQGEMPAKPEKRRR